jgi:hypothetical protein
VLNHVCFLRFLASFEGIETLLQIGQSLIRGCSSGLGLFHLKAMAQHAREVEVLLVGRAVIDLGPVCFGVGMEGVGFARVV